MDSSAEAGSNRNISRWGQPETAAVDAELSAIFRASPPPQDRLAHGARPPTQASYPVLSTVRPAGALAFAGIVVAAALVGLAAGLWIEKARTSAQTPPAPVAASLQPVVAPADRLEPATAATAAAAPQPSQTPVASNGQFRQFETASALPSLPRPGGRACENLPSAERPACLRRTAGEARDSLEHAYDAAVKAGGAPKVVASYHERWMTADSRAADDPRAAIADYRRLEGALSSIAKRPEASWVVCSHTSNGCE